MRLSLVAVAAALSLSGCAQKSEHIEAAYVSPIPYEGFSCRQIREEAQRVSTRSAEVMGVQDQKAEEDAVATGVALILFWPAAFFVKGDEETAVEVANLKGQMNALQEVSEEKNCGIVFAQAKSEAASENDVQPVAGTETISGRVDQ